MSLLEVIMNASADSEALTYESDYPIVLNPDPVFLTLNPKWDAPNDVVRVEGWQISQTDSHLIDSSRKFFKKLKRKLKNPSLLTKDEFHEMLNSYLEKSSERAGVSTGVDPSDEGYNCKLVEKVGFLMGSEVKGLVLEGCVVLEIWELLETLIVCGLVEHSSSSNLVHNLIEKRRSDLVCLCVKHVSDLRTADLLSVLKYFLLPPNGGYESMVRVREEWESQALSAVERATDSKLSGKKLKLAKEASVLLMIAYDGFSASELCLHYLLASSNLDEVVLSSCISKLIGSEIMSLIQYLGKWVKKYERFPQAGPCPKASSSLGLKSCEWVPRLEDIVKCLGLVLDEHFLSLVLHSEFHEELRSIEGLVNALSLESKVCCSMANVIESLRTEVKGANSEFFSYCSNFASSLVLC